MQAVDSKKTVKYDVDGYDMPWPMSIMMKCFTAQSDDEIRFCMKMLLNTDAHQPQQLGASATKSSSRI